MNISKETKDSSNINKKKLNFKMPSKKDVVLFLAVFVVNLAMCSAFLQPHYPHETYKLMNIGYAEYSKLYFFREGRPFTAILATLMGILNVPVEICSVVSFVIAIIFLSISIVILYKLFKKKIEKDSKLINVILILSAFLVIMNYFEIEYIFFIESAVMALAMLLSVIIAKINIDNEENKYVKSFLLGLIVAFCYQGALAIFPIIVLTYKLLLEKHTIKENIKEIVKISFIYIILMLITIIYSEVLFGGSRVQVGVATVTFTKIINWVKRLAVDSLGVIPSFVHIGFIIFTTILILMFHNKKEKGLFALKYLFIIIYAIVMSLAPIVGGSGLELTPRTCIAYSCTIGISLFILLWIMSQNNKKYQLNLLLVVTIITFALNFMVYVVITNQHLKVNKLDKENCFKIEKALEEYESKNNIKVTKIASLRKDDDEKQYYSGFIHAGTLTRSALKTWPAREIIKHYTERELQFVKFPLKYVTYFSEKTYPEFSLEQLLIEGDTLYFYGG